jgi:hypothetical protein
VVESPKTTGRASPQDPIPVSGKIINSSGRRRDLAAVVGHSSILQETAAPELIANPKSSGWLREQTADVRREKFVPERRVERLESNAVKAKQSGWSSKPEETVGSLRQGNDVFRRSLLEGPAIVVDLEASCGLCLSD